MADFYADRSVLVKRYIAEVRDHEDGVGAIATKVRRHGFITHRQRHERSNSER